MPRLTDESILKQIVAALEATEGCDHVLWKGTPQEELKRDAPHLSQRAINKAMRALARVGKMDVAAEPHEEWKIHSDCHYDFRFSIAGYRVYVKTVLITDSPSHPELFVVSFHVDSKPKSGPKEATIR